MLSYLHAYHAGNHADILKHLTLTLILDQLNEKAKPYTVFDTHAGSGLYDLFDEKSLKTNEAKNGILHLLTTIEKSEYPLPLQKYLEICKAYKSQSPENTILYPGSPLIERDLITDECEHILCELHKTEFENLKENLKGTTSKIHNRNGFEALLALTPPNIKRGLAIIDPSYEETSDYTLCESTICKVHKKWPVGIICLWYPLLAKRKIEIENLKQNIIAKIKVETKSCNILVAELQVNLENSHIETTLENNDSSNPPRLYGSGMIVINAPWKLKEKLEESLSYLSKILQADNNGSYKIQSFEEN